jgi:hypothetical protein
VKLFRYSLVAVTVLLLVTSIATSPKAQSAAATTPAPTPAPGVAEGQKIGNIVKSAITTAAPGLSSLLDLIWGALKKPDTDKATKADLKTASTQVQTKATTDAVAAAQEKVQDVTKISDEIGVITKFLNPAVTVSPYLTIIRTKASESTPDWQGIQNAWEIAKGQIDLLKAIPDSDLAKVRDPYLRDRLRAMRDANGTTAISVGQEVAQKNINDLKTDLPILLNIYAAMTGIAGFELAELQAEIIDLANWAKGHMGASDAAPDQRAYMKLIDNSVPHK